MFVELVKEHMGQKPGYRFDTDEPVAKALVEKGFAKELKDDPLGPIMAKSLEGILANLTNVLSTQIDEGIKEFAQAASKSRKNAIPQIFGEGQKGDPKKTFGHFLLAVRAKDHKALEEMGSYFVEWEGASQKTAMATTTGTTGGYAVPTEHYDRLMAIATEESVVRPRATIIPMTSRTIQVPCLDVTTAPASGDSAYLGGVVARWTEEGTTENESEPAFKQADLTNYELSGYSKISNALTQDNAIGLEAFLNQLFGRAIAWYEDYAFLRGNGAGKPLGVLNWAGLISVTRSAASAFALADAAGMLGRFLPGYNSKKSCWVVHPTVLVKLFQIVSSAGNIGFLADVRDKPTMTLLGLPVEVSEKLPALNTLGDVMLCNFDQYLLGDRQQIEIAYSEHVEFLTNRSVWRFVSRVGGQPWLRDKVTLSDASSTLAPFVGLAAG